MWDGDSDCEHEWVSDIKKWHSDRGNKPRKEVFDDNFQIQGTHNAFCLKCGAWHGQLGLEPTLDMFIDHLLQITAELKRVLKKTGTLWWNMGDNYSGSSCGSNDYRPRGASISCNSNKYVGQKPGKSNIPAKSLCLQNFRLAQRMVDEQGFILRNILVWKKDNCMPSSVKDRFTVDFEPVFFFVKNKKYYFEQQLEPYTTPLNRWGGEQLKADGHSLWDEGTGQSTYRKRNLRPNKNGRNQRCVLSINTQPLKEAHFAVMPEQLVEPMIKAGCPKHGIVLDPFMGAGTVGVVAKKLERNYMGIELNPEYIKIAEKRIAKTRVVKTLFDF